VQQRSNRGVWWCRAIAPPISSISNHSSAAKRRRLMTLSSRFFSTGLLMTQTMTSRRHLRKKRYEKSFVLDRSQTEKELQRFSVFPAPSVPAFINNAPGTHYVVAQGLSDGRSAQKGRRCCDSGNTCNGLLVMARWDGNDVMPSSLSTPFYSIKII
jgi:hypothetical protein